ncbi:MAG: B12-binding domain-containing radical SAM protein [Anaerolineae bacterium]
MRVLLIQPKQNQGIGLERLDLIEPLGLEMIAGALQDGHEIALLDLRLQPEALSTMLADFRPQVVGISSTFTVKMYQTLHIAEIAKATDPQTFVVVGGHHPSLYPRDFQHPAVDAIVVGEGEVTTRELVDCLAAGGDPSRVPGLVLNRPEGQHFTGQRAPVHNLDVLPHPQRVLTRPYRLYYHLFTERPIAAMETTRGCPYQCNFCAVWRFYQGRVRFKSPQRVADELESIAEPKVFFTDDNFLANVRRSKEIARLIKERGIRKQYYVQARSDVIVRHPELITQWREVGLSGVFIGFEKPDQAGLDAVNKSNSVENNEKALTVLRQHGIEPDVSFIVDPDYDHADFAALRRYVRRLKLRLPFFAVLTPLPGTAFFDAVKDQLVTHNYELFDVLHAVLPTRLPLTEFYAEMARLYREAYPLWKLWLGKVYLALLDIWWRGPRPLSWRQLLDEVARVGEARAYLES